LRKARRCPSILVADDHVAQLVANPSAGLDPPKDRARLAEEHRALLAAIDAAESDWSPSEARYPSSAPATCGRAVRIRP
jgi:hypothetical protein